MRISNQIIRKEEKKDFCGFHPCIFESGRKVKIVGLAPLLILNKKSSLSRWENSLFLSTLDFRSNVTGNSTKSG